MPKSLLIYFLSNIISKLASFILLPFFLLYLTINDFGRIESILLTVNLIAPFSFLLVDSWLEKNNLILSKEKYFIRVVNTILSFGFVVTALAVVIYFILIGIDDLLIFSTSVFSLPFANVIRLKLLKLRYVDDLKSFFFINIFQSFVLLVTGFLLFYFFSNYLFLFFLSQLITSVLTNWFCNYRLKRNVIFTSLFAIDFKIIFKSLKFTYPLIPANYINLLLTNSYRYFSLLFFSTDKLGIVGVCTRFSTPMSMVGDSYLNYISPLVFKETENTKLELKHAINLFLFGLPVLLIVYYLFVELLIFYDFLKLDNEILLLLRIFLCVTYVGLIIKLDFFVLVKYAKTNFVLYCNLFYLFLLLCLSILIKLGFVDFDQMLRIVLMISCFMVVLMYFVGNKVIGIPLMLNLKTRLIVILIPIFLAWFF